MDLFYIAPQLLGGAFPHHKSRLQKLANQWEHLLVINLCEEKPTYTLKGVQVENWPVVDGLAMAFASLQQLVKHIDSFITTGSGKNSVFVHCKHGKGRTGMVLIGYLLYKYHMDVQEANLILEQQQPLYYSGVTIKTQLRYLEYLKKYVRNEIQWDFNNLEYQTEQRTWIIKSFLIVSEFAGYDFDVKIATFLKNASKKDLCWVKIGSLRSNINYQMQIDVYEDIIIRIEIKKLIQLSYTELGANLALENKLHANTLHFSYDETDGYAGTHHKGTQRYNSLGLTFTRPYNLVENGPNSLNK